MSMSTLIGLALMLAVPPTAAGSAAPTAPGLPDIRGATTCPTPRELQETLRPLLFGRGGLPANTWLSIADAPAGGSGAGEVEIRLERAHASAPIAMRRVTRAESCAETADILAVVLASWGSLFAPVPLAPLAPPPSPEDDSVATALAVAAPSTTSSWPPALGAAVALAAARGGGVAPAIGLDVSTWLGRSTASRALVGRVAVAGVGTHEASFGAVGRVVWRRILLAPGLALSWSPGSSGLFAEAGAGPLAGLLFVEGRGFDSNAGTINLDLGAAASVRAGARSARRRLAVWLGGGAWAYARRQRVHVNGVTGTQALPWLDATAAVGLAWTPGP
jgi:hypothetical protein